VTAVTQDEHRRINAREYPGTRQLCSECDEPTGRCEDDQLDGPNGPVCEACAETQSLKQENDDE
jgi:formylmethanofuran dehydrogenase subunit E